MDRVQLPTATSRAKDATPFALSFARAAGHLDVAIPDPSFWAWPEMLIAPFWEIVHDPKVTSWAEKPMRAFWRGGTARNSGLREVLIHCGKNSRHRGKGVTFDMKNAVWVLSGCAGMPGFTILRFVPRYLNTPRGPRPSL